MNIKLILSNLHFKGSIVCFRFVNDNVAIVPNKSAVATQWCSVRVVNDCMF